MTVTEAGDDACAVVAGGHQLLLAGDPIESVANASVDLGWCCVSFPGCPRS